MCETVLSSKGQIVLPAAIRKSKKLKIGARFKAVATPGGIFLVEISENPIKALSGIAKHIPIPKNAVKKLRQEDERLFRKKHGI